MAVYSVSNDDIVEALQKFELPVLYGEISENQTNDYNFFYYRETRITSSTPKYLVQELVVIYVSKNQEDLKEVEIIETLEGIGLTMSEPAVDYDRMRVEESNDFVDIVTFTCNRKMKKRCPR